MGSEKERRIGRFTSGAIIGSGSAIDRVSQIWAGSVEVTTPIFDAASGVGCQLAVSTTVAGLDASQLIIAMPGSHPGDAVMTSVCAITDAIETQWLHTGSAAVAACAVTLQFIAFKTVTQ